MRTGVLDMTEGRPLSLLLRFSLPTLASNVLYQIYTITDSIIVGRHLGETALAAVGCTMPIAVLLGAMIFGVNNGVGILLSQCFGRQDIDGMRRTFANSLYFGLALPLISAILGPLLAEPILTWMGTPPGPLADAAAYLRVSFMTAACPMFYYLFNCGFRGLGDSQTPLYCMTVSVVSNVGLDLLFVVVFEMGVAGSAWATALAQAMAAVVTAVLLWKKHPEMRPTRADLVPSSPLLKDITRISAPIAVQSAFNNLGNIAAQSAVNRFDAVAMAAYTAGNRIGSLALLPLEAVGTALSIYAGQNHGANKPDRVRAGVIAALKIAAVFSVALGLLIFIFGRQLSMLFLKEPSTAVLDISENFLLITAVPGILAGVMLVYQQVLRGIGKPNLAMAGGLTQLAVKIAVAIVGAWVFQSLTVVWLGWPASFIAGALVPMVYYYAVWVRRTGAARG